MTWFIVVRNDCHFVISDNQIKAFSVTDEEQRKSYKTKKEANKALMLIIKKRIFSLRKKLEQEI